MKKTNTLKTTISILTFVFITVGNAFALTTFQTYIDGATAGNLGRDQDTWFSSANPFNLFVVGAYNSNTISLTGVTLLISTPQGETGTISLTTSPYGDETPILLTTAGSSISGLNPKTDANVNILTNVSGNDGYDTIQDHTFLPFDINEHYPLKDNVSDFLIYNLSDFTKTENNLNNYDADHGGSISTTSTRGEQKEYLVSYTGFSQLHFDVYGLETYENCSGAIKTTWDNNPGSHDATANGSRGSSAPVPEPATLSLLGLGLVGLLGFRRKK